MLGGSGPLPASRVMAAGVESGGGAPIQGTWQPRAQSEKVLLCPGWVGGTGDVARRKRHADHAAPESGSFIADMQEESHVVQKYDFIQTFL